MLQKYRNIVTIIKAEMKLVLRKNLSRWKKGNILFCEIFSQ